MVMILDRGKMWTVSLADYLVLLNLGQRETTEGGTVGLLGRGFDRVVGKHRKSE